ncbi:putative polyol transporter 1 isoform X1 [Telopea speciosissima]|uniref:putative polyol transporter 1 isoform X1 n=1 Tax=Telopea speciosissima TaxID=54955 RepID=UPI001CC5907B|nr:putative polyol transporter 1 isoform X1 [Telopea speciosissima]
MEIEGKKEQPKLNKYALGCAIVASLISIIFGYGASLSLSLSFSLKKMAESKASNNAAYGPPEVFQSPGKRPRNKYALGCATLASMTSVLLGYDIGVMSGAALFIKDDLKVTDTQIEILLGIINIYSLIGSAAAGRTSDWIGRRYTIVFAAVIFFVGALLMGFATNYAFLMVGRFVAGVGIGYALMIAPVYTAEVAPASCRGFLTSFPEVFINAGILLGYVSNFAFAGLSLHLGWRLMLGVGAIPSIFLGLGVLAMPESPRWLVMQGRLGDAIKVLDKTSDSKEEAQLRLADIKEAARIPPECNEDVVAVPKQSHGEGVWKELFLHPTPAVRRVVIAGIGIHFFQQASGIDAVVLYSPRIFEKAGIHDKNKKLGATVAVGFVKTIFILVSTFFVDKVGRRPLLLSSVAGMILSLGFLGFGLTMVDIHPNDKLVWAIAICILMVLAYVAFFSIGMGPITWVYSSEVFPLRLRAQGCSVAVAVNRVTSGVISMTFLSLSKAITIGGAFFLFAGIALVAWLFFFTFLPETQGKNLEDMDALFGKFHWKESLHKKGNNGSKETTSNGDVQLGNKA